MFRLTRLACVLLVLVCSTAAFGADPPHACKRRLSKIADNRLWPHGFYDQATETINSIYPNRVILVSRRSSRIGTHPYSLIVYRVEPTSTVIHIDAMAIDHPDAWVYSVECPADQGMEGLVTTLEEISHLSEERPSSSN